ncbi:hypothetical protein BH11ARM2_BH11ARM2_03900 [soil metagenome]
MSHLQLAPQELDIVRRILRQYVPGIKAMAFGSRATGRARQWSDLDLILLPPSALSTETLGDLREAFMESDLPMRVDILDAHRVDEEIRGIAMREAVELP